jgi:16S rRNA (guanine527-N7)-methyltransferase
MSEPAAFGPSDFRGACERLGVAVSDSALMLLGSFTELLLDWNSRINLISRKDTGDIWRRHLLPSAAVLGFVRLPQVASVFDLGSGGGLPGLPLAILRPDIRFTLCDATGKKIRAVEDMAAALGIANLRCVHARVEDLADDREFAGRYDAVTARAVTRLDTLFSWSRPLLRADGPRMLIAYKGGDLTEERRGIAGSLRGYRLDEMLMDIPGEPWFAEQKKKIVVIRPR